MDPLWKRDEAVSILGIPNKKKRIIIEGLYDKLILKHMSDSGNYNLSPIEYQNVSNNKKSVVQFVSQSITSDVTPPTIGLVDMDEDLEGVKLNEIISNFSKIHGTDESDLISFVRDTRKNTCLFSLISSKIGDGWSWLGRLSEELNLSKEWKNDLELVIKISKFRTGIHMIKQNNQPRAKNIDINAFKNTKKTSLEFTFTNWLDLYLKHKNNPLIQREYVNDHCLEATVSDWIIYDSNIRLEPVKLEQKVKSGLLNLLKREISSNNIQIENLLDHVGNPFKKTT